MEKYRDADAIVTIEGRDYALYRKGPIRKNPHMKDITTYIVDITTDEIPYYEQRPLMNSYLQLNGIRIGPQDTTYGCIHQAIKVAQGKMRNK